jgi:hypothetical protein
VLCPDVEHDLKSAFAELAVRRAVEPDDRYG